MTKTFTAFCFFPWEEFSDLFIAFPPILTEDKKVMIMSGREKDGTGIAQC